MTETVSFTCDRSNNVIRLAVWRGTKIGDLYLDRVDAPDPTGGVWAGKVDRVAAGGGAAWVHAGLSELVFIEKAGGLKAGQKVFVEVQVPARQGKAHQGLLREDVDVTLPPRPWARALRDLSGEKISAMTFSHREDRTACEVFLQETRPDLVEKLQPLSKEPVHPDLDDLIGDLQETHITLNANASLVLEETEALVAIDINAEKGANALAVNLAAAQEIARQIRLRNLGGIIVIDALKMTKREDTAKLLNALKRATVGDPAGVDVFGMTKLGLVEMTRRRRGLSLAEVVRA